MGGNGSRGWYVSSNVSVGTVVVAQMGGVGGGVQETVKLEYTSWWCTKGYSRGSIIR